MTEEKFNKKMEDWAEREINAAPELRPTAEMYRLVEAHGQRGWRSWTQPRWATIGLALTAFVILIIGGFVLGDLDTWLNPVDTPQVAFVEQRAGTKLQPPPPEKGKGRGSHSFQELSFQVSYAATRKIESIDLRNSLAEIITLTTQDDFRLLIQPSQPGYIYIYMISPDDQYQALHPETEFNPLNPANSTILPSQPNWFYISGENGNYRLLLITAPNAVPELDKRYQQYIQQSTSTDFESAQRALSEYIESIRIEEIKNLEMIELTINLKD